MGVVLGVGELPKQGRVCHHLLPCYALLLHQGCRWVTAPVGFVELTIADAFVVDVLV